MFSDSDSRFGKAMPGIICLLVIFQTLLRAQLRPVSIFPSSGMLASTLNGDEILSAARCFFPWRLGGSSARTLECSMSNLRWFDLRFGEDFGPLAGAEDPRITVAAKCQRIEIV